MTCKNDGCINGKIVFGTGIGTYRLDPCPDCAQDKGEVKCKHRWMANALHPMNPAWCPDCKKYEDEVDQTERYDFVKGRGCQDMAPSPTSAPGPFKVFGGQQINDEHEYWVEGPGIEPLGDGNWPEDVDALAKLCNTIHANAYAAGLKDGGGR